MAVRKIKITIPTKDRLLRKCCQVTTVDKGRWSATCLPDHAKERGIYIFHKGGRIKYIGMTGGDTMDFATRLRRHLQKSAAPKKYYPRLKQLRTFCVSFLTDKEILNLLSPRMRQHGRIPKSIILLMEAALIHIYTPEFQRGKDEPKAS
jgi:hypothetical protein